MEEWPSFPIGVKRKKEYKGEAILIQEGKGARRLYLVIWKGYHTTNASEELEFHLENATLVLKIYLHRIGTKD